MYDQKDANMATIGVRIPPGVRLELDHLARMTGMTTSEVCRWMLMRAVDHEAIVANGSPADQGGNT